jgi:hypothetical protein
MLFFKQKCFYILNGTTYQIQKIDIRHGPHPLVPHQSNQHQRISNNRQHEYNNIERYNKLAFKHASRRSSSASSCATEISCEIEQIGR